MRADTPEGVRVATALGRTDGVVRQADADGWAIFHVRPHANRETPVGAALPLRTVQASPSSATADSMHDGSIETAWTAGSSQVGDEQVTIDLGEPREVGAVTLCLGQFVSGFPRNLAIETSPDGAQWTPAWQGATAAASIRAGLADPRTVPLRLEIEPVATRFVRLRQTGSAPGFPWWIAELEVHAAAIAPDH